MYTADKILNLPLYGSALASCWNTSTYRLRMLRFTVCCDLGLPGGGNEPGGGVPEPGGGPVEFNRSPVGVVGVDSVGGARLERIRIGPFVGGSELKSIADDERTGGPDAGDAREPLIPGEAV